MTQKEFKPIVFSEDMDDEKLEFVMATTKDAMGLVDPAMPTSMMLISDHIRAKMQSHTGNKGWNVICGRNFGAYVTHELRTFAYFTVTERFNVLVWCC
mmetsp:Transcript_11972/g.28054  ORF Transcript_11972/g.28054 Transcript_11972/m.28054 type:complete len:98 (+) Transcript_11972:55-348(+)